MNILLGYNFCSDGNCLDPSVVNISEIDDTILKNGIYDHFNVSSDVTSARSTTIPSSWDSYTLLNCNFNGNINGGSLTDITRNITGVRIKRRKSGDFNWITIKEITITDTSQFSFVFNDYLAEYNTEYEYALVPMTNDTEGSYIVNEVLSKFIGVFICDTDTAFRIFGGASYGTTTTMQKTGTFEPFGRQYPIVVSNGLTNYETGSFSGYVFPPSYYSGEDVDAQDIVEERKLLMAFLTNKKAKILKDSNGNMWLVMITSSPSTSYDSNVGMSVVKASASWTEIGNSNDAEDLYNAGMIPTVQ